MNPDGSKRVPPEEKLLRLIRGTPQSASRSSQEPATVPAASSLPRTRLLRWQLPSWGLHSITMLLGGVIIIEAILMVGLISAPPPVLDLASFSAEQPAPPLPPAPKEAPSGLAASVSQPLFQVAIPRSSAPAPSSAAPSASASALITQLTLLGIVSGERPQAIIEDTRTHKTYFVTAGQHVIEGLIVEAVHADRVTLTVNGERVELSL